MMRLGDTPVPIPNTTVKTQAVDGTWWAAAWESRWLPKSYGLIAQLVRAHRTSSPLEPILCGLGI